MLEQAFIKNFALIQEQTLQFDQSLNILSGETGAGKSILIDAINFALGGRGNKDLIRTGETEVLVELFFCDVNSSVCQLLSEYGVEMEENTLLLSRTLSTQGKSICRVNGRVITLGMMKEIGKLLIDIHGQHEHQSLLNSSRHIELLDQFGKEEVLIVKKCISELYKEYKEIQQKLDQLGCNDAEKARKIDLLKFQIREIQDAKLQPNEEESLTQKYKLLSNLDKQFSNINEIYDILVNDETVGNHALSSAVDYLLKKLQEVVAIDSSLENLYRSFEAVSYQLQDCAYELRDYKDQLEFDPHELYEIEKRLDFLYTLKRKYGSNEEEILQYLNELEKELDILENSEQQMLELQRQLVTIEAELKEKSDTLTEKRKAISSMIKKSILQHLEDLDMKNVEFDICFQNKKDYSPNGIDDVEFMISTNMGEPLKSLSKIASGGEISRVMLALKTVLSEVDSIASLIFDEIDTGISGKAAQKVAEKIASISKRYQILCITHLPQIASMSDKHLYIEKISNHQQTTTHISDLNDVQKIREIARMIGGVSITENTLKNAAEMLDLARDKKMAL